MLTPGEVRAPLAMSHMRTVSVTEQIETVIVGGGQAGLAMSYHLKRLGREHIVLEQKRVAERWRSERWDSLMFQFPNWTIQLPGHTYPTNDPAGFAPRDEVVRFIESYATLIGAPVRCGVRVLSVGQKPGSERFLVQTDHETLEAVNVVLATGPYQLPSITPLDAAVPPDIFQIHSRDYRNPQQLPPGAVLVVGSGASGCQIAEELYQTGRKVYLSIGHHCRVPRRYRRRDLFWWFDVLGMWDRSVDLHPEVKLERFLVTGAAGGHDIDLRRFAADGVTLLGRLRAVSEAKLSLAPDLEEKLALGDAWFAEFKKSMDDYARKVGMEGPEESEVEESVASGPKGSVPILELDLRAAGIASVIWASGFRHDFGWVGLPVVNETGEPVQRRGVTRCPGLYFLGLRRMHTLRSSLLPGVGDDAGYLAERIAART